MTRLAINLSSATILRQASRLAAPDPVHLALAAELGGADAICLHVREKRDLVSERDVKILRQTLSVPLFLQLAPTAQMTGLAMALKPELVTLVSEKTQSQMIGDGIDLVVYRNAVAETVMTLQSGGLPVCLSVAPDSEQIKIAHRLSVAAVKIHVGAFVRATSAARARLAAAIAESAAYAAKLKLGVHIGGGLDFPAIKQLCALQRIDWFCVGHSAVARAMLTGMQTAVSDFQHLLRCPQPDPQRR